MPYTIKDMSALTGLPASTLRYYDKQGLLPNLKRDGNNIRIFTDEDYGQLRIIECLKRSGLSIKDIKKFMDMAGKEGMLSGRLEIFRKRREILRQELEDLKGVLDVIEYKCWYYEKACEEGSESAMKDLSPSEVPERFRKARESLHRRLCNEEKIQACS
ncbi:MAG: MerR family transcriptional regulator [Synergistaceae bacterium]|nr:MerR family transcriptional regulator [Synergistaceae bacterium]